MAKCSVGYCKYLDGALNGHKVIGLRSNVQMCQIEAIIGLTSISSVCIIIISHRDGNWESAVTPVADNTVICVKEK